MTDLSAYASLADRVAALDLDQDITLTPADMPGDLAEVTPFDGLVIDTSFMRTIGWGGEGEFPFEIVDQSPGFEAFAMPDGFRRVGLWLLHLLFSGREWAGLELTHRTSRAQHLYARVIHPIVHVGLMTDGPPKVTAYEHWTQEVWRHPFADLHLTHVERLRSEEDRPRFAFGWSRDMLAHQFDTRHADQIILEATPEGIAAMAAVLMDMAHPEYGREEIDFEPPYLGFAATQPRSIEARFWLPGSIAFFCDTLEELTLRPWPSG
ncbi:hypothetical protein [Gymnodinialimonas hymeniacidonis]|uniref:hypothetical protein n=1 Tax=Gymnodinialimonas hymeniacidonis TaxID=3126508 RepID=UPI0034C62A4B